jgi:hypothetical protein
MQKYDPHICENPQIHKVKVNLTSYKFKKILVRIWKEGTKREVTVLYKQLITLKGMETK